MPADRRPAPRGRWPGVQLEQGHADHAEVAAVAGGTVAGVGILGIGEAERRDFPRALAEALDHQAGARFQHIAAVLQAARLAVEHVQAVHRGDHFVGRAAEVVQPQTVALAVAALQLQGAAVLHRVELAPVFVEHRETHPALGQGQFLEGPAVEATRAVEHLAAVDRLLRDTPQGHRSDREATPFAPLGAESLVGRRPGLLLRQAATAEASRPSSNTDDSVLRIGFSSPWTSGGGAPP
ncbi:Uncharacterised protein [Pseudomonas aeruginosa]|nr:Uncharacterised protein [Pseudomonas aeruginosa]